MNTDTLRSEEASFAQPNTPTQTPQMPIQNTELLIPDVFDRQQVTNHQTSWWKKDWFKEWERFAQHQT